MAVLEWPREPLRLDLTSMAFSVVLMFCASCSGAMIGGCGGHPEAAGGDFHCEVSPDRDPHAVAPISPIQNHSLATPSVL